MTAAKDEVILAALQIGAHTEGAASTIDHILSFESQLSAAKPDIVVMPEALLGGYPKGETFGAQLGFRTQDGRESYRRHYEAAVDMDGPEIAALAGLSARTKATVVVGIIERAGSSLFCTAIFIDPEQGLTAKHRKLMPTGTERLIWGQGDGSTMPVVNTRAGLAGAAICWENYMPLMRTALYAKGVDIWCAPTVDARDVWQSTMRHIAVEGRCFVVSACQVQGSPIAEGIDVENWDADVPLIRGGSVIVGPLGDILAGPLWNEAGLVAASVDLADLPRARYDFDVVGHYSRPDIFRLTIDEAERAGVTSINSGIRPPALPVKSTASDRKRVAKS